MCIRESICMELDRPKGLYQPGRRDTSTLLMLDIY